MQVRANTSQLLLQSQAQNRTFDIGQKNRVPLQIVDLTSSISSPKSERSVFGVNSAFKPVFESVARYKSEDVYEQKDVLKKQDVFETRAVYEEQEILETKVVGTDDLSELASLAEVGIKRGAQFSVSVGDGPSAVVKFVNAGTISVTVDGTVENFTFKARNGSFRTGLQDALNSISGVTAGYTAGGELSIEASDANSLSIADIKKSPLEKLGLSEGVIDATVVGYQQLQTGTEHVKTGEETTVVGTETIKVGTQQVLDGYDETIIGLERSGSFSPVNENFAPSEPNYLEQLFSAIRSETDLRSPLVSSEEVWSAYDETESANGFDEDVAADSFWPEEDNDHRN